MSSEPYQKSRVLSKHKKIKKIKRKICKYRTMARKFSLAVNYCILLKLAKNAELDLEFHLHNSF